MSLLTLLRDYELIRFAVVAALLASVLSGIVGTFVVVKKLVFITGGLAHAAFAGLGLFFFLGLEPRLGAVAVAVGGALLIEAMGRGKIASQDATVGIVWSLGMAIGIVFVALAPGYSPDLMGYLFGDILTVRLIDLVLLAGVAGAVLLFVALFYKELVAIAFDEDFARVRGVPVRPLMMTLMALVGLSVVQLIQVVGIVLVIALLTAPPLIGLALSRSFPGALVISTSTSAAVGIGGIGLSYRFDLPSGATIVLLAGLALGAVALGRRVISARRPATS